MSAEVFVNRYKAPESSIPKGIHGATPIEEYDLNYCFDIKTLRSDRVELRPFLVRHSITRTSQLIVIAFNPRQTIMGGFAA